LLGEAVAWDDEGELAKAASLSILSALLILTAASVSGRSARAEENCLAAPTGRAPAGSHWHYRTDPVKQTKCWYLRTEGEPAQTTAATEGSESAGAAAKPPAAAAAKPAAEPKPAADQAGSNAHQRRPHQTAHAASSGKPAQASPQNQNQAAPNNGQPASQPANGPAPWPDPPAQAAGGSVAWPDPPRPTMSVGPESATTNAPQEPPAAVQDTGSVNTDSANDAPAAAPVVGPDQPAASQGGEISGSTILALAIAMAFFGILLRWMVGRLFARRRKAAAERREPVWVKGERMMPGTVPLAPGQIDPERLDDEVKLALRKLLRTLERSAA